MEEAVERGGAVGTTAADGPSRAGEISGTVRHFIVLH